MLDHLHWLIAPFCLWVAAREFQKRNVARAILFCGIAVAVFGRVDIIFLITGMLVIVVGCVQLYREST